MSDSTREAVRKLRQSLGLTQTEFGQSIGSSLAMIQRYENLVAPKGKILAKLTQLAIEQGHEEFAKIFEDALDTELGVKVLRRVATTGSPSALTRPPIRRSDSLRFETDPSVVFEKGIVFETDEEKLWVGAFLRSMRQPSHSEEFRQATRVLSNVRSELEREREYLRLFPDFITEVGRLRGEGASRSVIAEVVGCDESVIDRIFQLSELIRPLFRRRGTEQILRILTALSLGHNHRMIAAEFRIPMQAVRTVVELRIHRLPEAT